MPTHQKWPNYQEFLAHLAGCFCTCEYTNVPFWAKMAHLSRMFIYPAVHLCGVHCICACVCLGPKSVGGITCAHAQSQYWAVKSDQ